VTLDGGYVDLDASGLRRDDLGVGGRCDESTNPRDEVLFVRMGGSDLLADEITGIGDDSAVCYGCGFGILRPTTI
jgi:hypothetical protein